MSISITEFSERLRASKILSTEDLATLLADVPAAPQGQRADAWIQRALATQRLTPFQVEAIEAGRGARLILGDYVILDKLGAGGMGQVFKAWHRRLKRLVALKTLPPSVSDDVELLKRFQREAEAAARLTHFNIVATYDAGEDQGVSYLVMEYVAGDDLSRAVRKHGPLPIDGAVSCVVQAARGLAYAHERGVIHRDIKPANLLLDMQGTLKILDMGLARFDEAVLDTTREGLTQTGSMMGTIDFMSPEQARNSKAADERSDVYSLGCTLFFLLTGRAVFEGGTILERILAHREAPIPSLVKMCPKVTPALAQVFERMVAKEPSNRWQSMDEVILALTDVLPDEGSRPVLTGGASLASTMPAGKSGVGRRRLRMVLLLSATLIVAAVASAAAIWNPWSKLKTSDEQPATRQPIVEETNSEGARPPLLVTPFSSATARQGQADWARHLAIDEVVDGPLGIQFTLIPSGEFQMGSPLGEEQRASDEAVHTVTISRPFYLANREVTVGQFREFATAAKYITDAERDQSGGYGWNSDSGKFEYKSEYTWRTVGFPQDDSHPVVMISWNDATALCKWLTEKDGVRYRLPSEAEWEYACQAGVLAAWHSGPDSQRLTQVANVADATGKAKYADWEATTATDGHVFTAPVGRYRPNAFGLFDMHGNAWEWCHDWYEQDYYLRTPLEDPTGPFKGTYRVTRGGGWGSWPQLCRSAKRFPHPPNTRRANLGVRLARELSEPARATLAGEVRPSVPTQEPPPLVAPFDASAARRAQRDWSAWLRSTIVIKTRLGSTLALIPPGEFHMGTSTAEIERLLRGAGHVAPSYFDRERPQHLVRLAQPYRIGTHEVTQEEFQNVLGRNPSRFRASGSNADKVREIDTARFPVEGVNWFEAVEFCNALSEREGLPPYYEISNVERDAEGAIAKAEVSTAVSGKGFRLPTEAEWEFACRAGVMAPFSFGEMLTRREANIEGIPPVGNHSRLSHLGRTTAVGSYAANPFGLYDMHGNVFEWCQDSFAGPYQTATDEIPRDTLDSATASSLERIVRGGGWNSLAFSSRSADRGRSSPHDRNSDLGFRVVRSE